MSLINAMDHRALSGFATAVALALDLDADADSDAILSTLQRRLNTPPAPRNVEGFERDQLGKICQYLTEHLQGEPAVTFENAPELVCVVMNDYREADHLRAYHAEHVEQLRALPQPKREPWVRVRDLREQLDQLDTAYSVGAFEDGQPDDVMQALRQLVESCSLPSETQTVIDNAKLQGFHNLQRDVAHVIKSPSWMANTHTANTLEQLRKELAAYHRDHSAVREESITMSDLRLFAEELAGFEPGTTSGYESPMHNIRQLVNYLRTNQKPEGFDQAAEDMVERLRRYELAFASVRNLVALV